MNFHETTMGHLFFERQLPQLIHVLESISQKLSHPSTVIKLSDAADPEFLKELYWHSGLLKSLKESSLRNHDAVKAQQTFLPLLPKEGREAFESYEEIIAEREGKSAERAYQAGFQTAIQMMVSGLSVNGVEEVSDDP